MKKQNPCLVRLSDPQLKLIEDAASKLGENRTEFIRVAAIEKARLVLLPESTEVIPA